MIKKHQAQFVFYYLLSLISLGAMALGLGIIVFEVLDKVFVDVSSSYFSMQALKTAFSTLIISTPIYYICSHLLSKSIRKNELSLESSLRKWLIYLILLVTSVIMLVWLVSILNSFLNGEMTIKFILKALTALIISAMIFSYYLYNIKQKVVKKKDKIKSIFFVASLLLVIFTLGLAIVHMESPQTTRDKKVDEDILRNFDNINMNVNMYYNSNKELPESLEELKSNSNLNVYPDSAVSLDNIEYKKLSEIKYELCTDFKTSNLDDKNINLRYGSNRLHNSGYQCLEQEFMGVK
jgi:cation transport ATPase